jgi:hypothetical protein
LKTFTRFYYPAKGTDYPIVFPYDDVKEIGVAVAGVPTTAWGLIHPGVLRLAVEPSGVVCIYSKDPVNSAADDYREALGRDATDGVHYDANHAQIHNVADPAAPTDAATKAYVDQAIAAALQNLQTTMVNQLIAAIEHSVSDGSK